MTTDINIDTIKRGNKSDCLHRQNLACGGNAAQAFDFGKFICNRRISQNIFHIGAVAKNRVFWRFNELGSPSSKGR